MVKEDGVSLARVGAPQNNEVRVLHLAIRTRPASRTKNRRQTGDARGVSSAVATVDVVRAHHRPRELLGEIVQLVRRLRTTEHAKGLRSVALLDAPKAGSGGVKSLIPTGGTKLLPFPNHGLVSRAFIEFFIISLLYSTRRISHATESGIALLPESSIRNPELLRLEFES